MGYTTDFIGHIDIAPGLNANEIAYLTAFSESRRFVRPGGPYEVPGNPRAETSDGIAVADYNRPPAGQPGLWCDWVPCWDGCCLAFNGNEKFYDPTSWLRYLVRHFLAPGAPASRTPDHRLRGFTFNHVLDGMVVGCRRDNKELYAIVVRNNRVRERVLRPSKPADVDRPPLPYELASDRRASEGRRRGTTRGGLATVTPISS